MKFQCVAAAVCVVFLTGSAWADAPIGTLEADGRFEVRAADDARATRFDQDEYTFFAGDTVITRSGPAVLNLANGGGLGVTEGSELTVSIDNDGRVSAEVISGSVLYAFPEGQEGFVFQAGNFTAVGNESSPRAIQVSRGAESVGTIELLEDGNLRAAVREGTLVVTNGQAVRYQVNAGESIGLLDLPNRTIQVQNPASGRTVSIEAPDQVGTNDQFTVSWNGSGAGNGDFIVIAPEGAAPDEFEFVVSSEEGQTLEFVAPGTPGDYEIRFIDGTTGAVKQFRALDVVGEIAAVPFWQNPGIGVVAGAAAVYIGAQVIDDDDPRPASP